MTGKKLERIERGTLGRTCRSSRSGWPLARALFCKFLQCRLLMIMLAVVYRMLCEV